MIRIRSLGPVAVTVDDGPPPSDLIWKKHLALLVYLGRSPRRTRSRDHLLGLLWGDKPEAAARHSLNEALRIIRRAAGPKALDTATDQVTLSEGVVGLDSDEFETAVASQDLSTACQLVQGEFLEGFTLTDAQPFEDWLHQERRSWRDRGIDALCTLARGRTRAGDSAEARRIAERAVRLDADSERAVRALIEALVVSDDGPTAVAVFERFRTEISERTGAAPSADLVTLIDQLKRHGGRSVRRGAEASPTGRSVRRVPLVGRTGELALIRDLWDRTLAGQANAIVLLGDLGAGKTRIIEEILRVGTLDGAVGSLFRAVEADRSRSGTGLLGLAAGGLGLARGIVGAPPAALATLASRLPEWSDRFPSARGVPELSLGEAFLAAVQAAAAESPVLLAIDDAQWCDRESLHTLVAALRDGPSRPLLIVFGLVSSGEAPELDALRSQLGRGQPGAAIDLGPLDHGAIVELTRQALPNHGDVQVDRLARRIAADSGGSPLLVTGLIEAVSGGLELTGASESWPKTAQTLSETLPGDLPDSVIAAIRIAVRHLSPQAQQVLAAAAILESRIDPDLLAAATGLAEGDLDGALSELEWNRWLVPDPQGYTFSARLHQQVIARDFVTAATRRRMLARLSTPT